MIDMVIQAKQKIFFLFFSLIILFIANEIYSTSVSASLSIPSYIAPSNPTLTLSNNFIDQGQSILFTAGVSNGNTLFTYNYVISNSITNIMIANMLFTGVTSTSNTWFWTPPASLYTSNTFQANVVITETGGYANTVNTVWTPFGYNAALTTPTLTTNPVFPVTWETGNTVTFTASFTGGTNSYTYNYQVINTIDNTLIGNMLLTNGFTSNSWVWTIPSSAKGNTIKANVQITDHPTISTFSNSVYSGTLTIIASTSAVGGVGGNITFLTFAQPISYLPDLFFVFSICILVVRLAKLGEKGYIWSVLYIFAALLMFMAFYFYVFPPQGAQTFSATTTNVPACTSSSCTTNLAVTNASITNTQQGIGVKTYGFIQLATITGFYIIILFLLAIKEFLDTKYIINQRRK